MIPVCVLMFGCGGTNASRADKVIGEDSSSAELAEKNTTAVVSTDKKFERFSVRITVGEPRLGESCDAEDISAKLRSKRHILQYCYEAELYVNSELSGEVVVQWEIGLDGEPFNLSIGSSTMNEPGVADCLLRGFARINFKPLDVVCSVSQPLSFERVR
jgi:hypothetical protein